MIDVRELRVGNLLLKDRVVVTIDARSIFDIWDKSDKYSPISITQEWLLRFGFIKIVEGVRIDLEYGDIEYDGKFILLCYGGYAEEGLPIEHIKYIHQLQNIYFALTGQELTLKQ